MCEHICENTVGGYNCMCEREHTLATDFYNCLGKLNFEDSLPFESFGIKF